MNNRKSYNSIVFLTTLSVYLGLVLVGGSPSVLAHSALTRQFDIKHEIVFEDDLDKKPDGDELGELSNSLDAYFEEIRGFIEDLQKLRRNDSFNLDLEGFEFRQSRFVSCYADRENVAKTETARLIKNALLEPLVTERGEIFADRWRYLGDCLKDETGFAIKSSAEITYDQSEVRIALSAVKTSPQKAVALAENFNRALNIYRTDDAQLLVKQIHANTSFRVENNQVFIVTRLPRAALEDSSAETDVR